MVDPRILCGPPTKFKNSSCKTPPMCLEVVLLTSASATGASSAADDLQKVEHLRPHSRMFYFSMLVRTKSGSTMQRGCDPVAIYVL